MTIFRLGRYRVRPDGIDTTLQVIRRTVAITHNEEPTTLIYLGLQDRADPTRFVHVSAYTDEAAMQRHMQGEAMLRDFQTHLFPVFEEPAAFTHYTLVDGKLSALSRE